MPIIGKVGRKTFKVRTLNSFIHLILIIGALTMIYPFLVMVSASFKSNVDSQSFSVYPQYFFNEDMLYRKYIEARFNELGDHLIEQYGNRYLGFTLLQPPANPQKIYYDDWQDFLRQNSHKHSVFDYYVSEQFGWGIFPRNERYFRQFMKDKTNGSLEKLNEKYSTSTLSWQEVRLEERNITGRNFTGAYSGFLTEYEEFRQNLPLWHRDYVSFDGNFCLTQLIPEFRNNLSELNRELGTEFNNWQEINLSKEMPSGPLQPYWTSYMKHNCNIHAVKLKPDALPAWKDFLEQKYDSVRLLNRTWQKDYQCFNQILLPSSLPNSGALPVDYAFFLENVAEPQWLLLDSVELEFRNWLQNRYDTIQNLNYAYKKGYRNFSAVTLKQNLPADNISEADAWFEFIRFEAEPQDLRLLSQSQNQFLNFLTEKYPQENGELDIAWLNHTYDTDYTSALNIYPESIIPADPEYRTDWLQFIRNFADKRFVQVMPSQQNNWQKFLQKKYQNIEKLNKDWHLLWNDFSEVPVDHYQIDYQIFKEHKKKIFWEFFSRNYLMVLDEMLYNGRAILNTVIYCLLAIFTALIVNPLAAYAMSRYKMPATYKIILVLMLTMAFPPMVMGIPNFLVMKKLGMLNTFWALILPGIADGYFIFLLKGFFDSLPKELFESATIDGASEWTIFWRIAMSLSKPIMAVIALNAFNAAYRNFMFAFIVCQDKSMWTMMVNIYQLMQRASAGVGFAALVIASIPTFAVFVFFQNIIIRGIVVPTEK